MSLRALASPLGVTGREKNIIIRVTENGETRCGGGDFGRRDVNTKPMLVYTVK